MHGSIGRVAPRGSPRHPPGPRDLAPPAPLPALSIRITAPDGGTREVPFSVPELTLGRAPDNVIVIDGDGISSHHCAFIPHGPQCVVQDRGSTNGTFVNNDEVQQSRPLVESDRVYVGQYLLQVVPGGAAGRPASAVAAGADGGDMGPLIVQRSDRQWRDQCKRLQRYAQQWDEAGRPDRLALTPPQLREAKAWLAQTPPHRAEEITSLQREFIALSRGAIARTTLKRVASGLGLLIALAGVVTGAVLLWPDDSGDETDAALADRDGEDLDETMADLPPRPLEPSPPPPPPEPRLSRCDKDRVVHEVIPGETLRDIAQRYGVRVAELAEWNLIDPSAPDPAPGTTLELERPQRCPLPQQKINYELEDVDTSWTRLSERFGISARKLRSYNPSTRTLRPGTPVVIWVDPKPYAPREPRQPIPDYVPTRTAQSIGSPNKGSLEGGIQIPDSPLYKRRYPYIMWGSGFLVANVQTAVAQFRNDMDFDGTLVLADVSRTKGGHFYPPHMSHQSGRDIDIWLPTLRGVFKEKYLTEGGEEKWGRRPNPEEVDWFAAWGLISALLDTEAVQNIFLSESVQPRVYDAAKLLGVSDERLDYALQYPKGRGEKPGVVIDSPGHSHHMHVRFMCASYEKRCDRRNVKP